MTSRASCIRQSALYISRMTSQTLSTAARGLEQPANRAALDNTLAIAYYRHVGSAIVRGSSEILAGDKLRPSYHALFCGSPAWNNHRRPAPRCDSGSFPDLSFEDLDQACE